MIGEMRHILTLQERILTADTGGGYAEDWQDVAENAQVYAAVETLSGRENLRQHRIQAAATHRITMRYRSDMTAEMRLTRGDAVYEIAAVIDPDNRREFLQVFAISRPTAV